MALADYFRRSAVAASQALGGYDEDALAAALDNATVEIAIGESLAAGEGRALADLTVRLLARLYPRILITGTNTDELRDLAIAINPNIDIVDTGATHSIVIGDAPASGNSVLYAGADGWLARHSTTQPRPLGDTTNPFGAGAAACIAASNLFRCILLPPAHHDLDTDLTFDTRGATAVPHTSPDTAIPDSTVLIGVGAIGNAALWALDTGEYTGTLHIVEPETVALSNLQRYVLTRRADEHARKVDLIDNDRLKIERHPTTWEQFVADHGTRWERVLVAVDSREGRHHTQASLPKWILNSWTQHGDLGVSTHPWTDGGCLSCLYLPTGVSPNEDELLATTFGLPHAIFGQQLRVILQANAPAPTDLLVQIADNLGIEHDIVLAYQDQPLRELYRGICGGAVIPLSRLGQPDHNVHVPLAHQSALAGILLAARLINDLGTSTDIRTATTTRLNPLASVGSETTQPLAKDQRGICICQDPDYQDAWAAKWGP